MNFIIDELEKWKVDTEIKMIDDVIKQEKKLVRIFFLDEDIDRFRRGIGGKIGETSIEVIPHPAIGSQYNSYRDLPEDIAQRIKNATQNGKIDYVVIGNNTGVGLQRARVVDESLRPDRTWIVWNNYIKGNEVPYEQLGYQQFVSRKDLTGLINKRIKSLCE